MEPEGFNAGTCTDLGTRACTWVTSVRPRPRFSAMRNETGAAMPSAAGSGPFICCGSAPSRPPIFQPRLKGSGSHSRLRSINAGQTLPAVSKLQCQKAAISNSKRDFLLCCGSVPARRPRGCVEGLSARGFRMHRSCAQPSASVPAQNNQHGSGNSWISVFSRAEQVGEL